MVNQYESSSYGLDGHRLFSHELRLKSYIETLSYDALIVLAHECGIDVPQDLSRSFLIGDLLEVAEEENEDDSMLVVKDPSDAPSDTGADGTGVLDTAEAAAGEPQAGAEQSGETFSDTCLPSDIAWVLSGPIWAYVYWNIGGRDAKRSRSLFVRINTFNTPPEQSSVKPCFNAINMKRLVLRLDDEESSGGDTEDTHLNVACGNLPDDSVLDEKEHPASQARSSAHYILIPNGMKYAQLELVALDASDNGSALDAYMASVAPPLASSAVFELPRPNPLLLQGAAALSAKLNPMQLLSGMRELVKAHYRDYRLSVME